MKRAVVLASACLVMSSLTGCSSDPRDAEIKKMVALIGEAADDVRSVADAVNKVVKDAKKDAEKRHDVTEVELKPAFEAVDRLKVLGVKFQNVKSRIDSFADLPNDNQKKAYVEANKADLEQNMKRLDTEQRSLEVALESAAPEINRGAMTALRKKLKEAEETFLTLGQRQ
jgi:methionine synthase II (cobalamin-independent)